MTGDEKHSAEQRTKIGRVYQAALERAPADRSAFVADACAGDDAVRREVESLLAYADDTERFIERPAAEIVARQVWASDTAASGSSPSLIGRQFGVYRIVSRLGAGGMGEVYRARDTTLSRDVAIKVLPPVFTADADRRGRFEREARLLAALNHPNIGSIYGLEDAGGARALVLELVEGETLADRIARGPVPPKEALAIARQIADALEAAHEKGIIHRDLKPANIKITPTGAVKVLDFGLAKAASGDGSARELTQSPTITVGGTRDGLLLGTAAYMSPEQARGLPVDRRADIWAFGCVMYEMLTGRIAFPGATVSDTLVAILERDPDWNALPAATPPTITRLLRRCLEKDPKRRLHDIADARIEIEDAWGDVRGTAAHTAIRVTSHRSRWITSGLVTVALVTGLVAATWYFRSPARGAPEIRFEIAMPEMPNPHDIALSPDGQYVAYAAAAGAGRVALWVRPINSVEARRLPGTEGAVEPFWSPDSKFLAFGVRTGATSSLRKIDVSGSAVQTVANLGPGGFCCGSWNRNGIIVLSHANVIHRVSASGGEVTRLTELDRSRQEQFHARPQILPDGRHFLYLAWSTAPENRSIYLGSLDSTTNTRLMATESNAVYAPPGFLLFLRERTLLARPFDADRLEFTGDPVPLARNIILNPVGAIGAFSASNEGTVIYRSDTATTGRRRMSWIERRGQPGGTVVASTDTIAVRLSPDDKQIAFAEGEGRAGGLWIHDVSRDVKTLLIAGAAGNTVWSSDGTRLIVSSGPIPRALYEKSSNGTSPERLLLPAEQGISLSPLDWSRDERFVVFAKNMPANVRDLWVLPRFDQRAPPHPYLVTPHDEPHAALSPDGRWLAYTSGESDTYHIVVQPFSDPSAGKWQISTDGGVCPRWSRDGRELYFLDPNSRIVAASLKTGTTFEVEKTTPLFETRLAFPIVSAYWPPCPYDVTADGQRFLVSEPVRSIPITVVVNWTSALERLAPAQEPAP